MFLEEYKEVYIANKKKIEDWEERIQEDVETTNRLSELLKDLNTQKEKLDEEIQNKTSFMEMYQAFTSQQEDVKDVSITKDIEDDSESYEEIEAIPNLDNVFYVMYGTGQGGRVYNAP